MGGAPSLKPFNVKVFPFFPIILTITTFILIASAEDRDSKENGGIPGLEEDNDAATSSPPPSSFGEVTKKSVSFKPNAKVIIGVLIATFALTILILLYIKHCNSGDTFVANPREAHLHRRKNSGIERDVVESLPVFRFGSLRGHKHGLECAVCLNRFEDPEVLRLLPKCKHAFHVECVDMWLDEHSTCPLCRYKVNINDVVQVEDQNQNVEEGEEEPSLTEDIESRRGNNNNNNDNHNNDNVLQPGNLGSSKNDNVLQPRSVGSSSSRKVSWVGERESELLEIVLQQEDSTGTSSFRRSLDSSNRKSGLHRLEHRIIISPSRGVCERWSDCQPSDLLYLKSDMIIKDGPSLQHSNNSSGCLGGRRGVVEGNRNEMVNGGGRKWRSVSAMTGMRRILSRERGREREHRGDGGRGGEEQEQRREGMVSRWLAWTSKSQSEREVC